MAIVSLPLHSYRTPAGKDLSEYMLASYHEFGGDMQKALNFYTAALKNDNSFYVYKGYLPFLYSVNQYTTILRLIPLMDKNFKDDVSIQIIIAQTLEKTGNSQAADERFIALSRKFKSNQEVAFHAAQSYLRRKEPENAIHIIDDMLNSSPRKPNNFIFHFLQAQIYVQLNNKKDALLQVKKSLEMHPGFDKGWLLYSLLKEQEGQLTDAIKGYTTFLELTGGNNEIEKHLLQLIFKQKMLQKNKPTFTVNKVCIEQALLLFEQKLYNQALEAINKCLEQAPDAKDSRLLKVQILSALQQLDEAARELKKWILADPENTLWYQTLYLLTRAGFPAENILSTFESIEKNQPDSLLAALYLADLYTRGQKTEKAIAAHTKAFKLTQDKELKAKILYHLGVLYYGQGNIEKVKTIIDQLGKVSTSYLPLQNFAAYFYATQGKNLVQAQQLMKTILKQDRTNPHYLDTQALIYYKQKKYAKAAKILKKLATIESHDCTILTHLSKVEYKQGNKTKALSLLQKAEAHARTKNEINQCKKLHNRWNTQQT